MQMPRSPARWKPTSVATRQADRKRFQRLVQEEQITRFIVGLPVHLDGRESQKSTEARRFGQWLAEATGVPVEFFDERFTTHEAERYLAAAQLSKKKRKARLDKLAAQIMLTAYLESLAAPIPMRPTNACAGWTSKRFHRPCQS